MSEMKPGRHDRRQIDRGRHNHSRYEYRESKCVLGMVPPTKNTQQDWLTFRERKQTPSAACPQLASPSLTIYPPPRRPHRSLYSTRTHHVLSRGTIDGTQQTCYNAMQWLTLVSSILQLIAIPTLCGASDVVGRRMILGGSLALSCVSTLCLGLAPNSIVAVSACQLVSCVAGAILPVSQAVIVDLST